MRDPLYVAPLLCGFGCVGLFLGITAFIAAVVYPARLRLPNILAGKRFRVSGPEKWRRVYMAAESLVVIALGAAGGVIVLGRADLDGGIALVCPAAELAFGIVWTLYLARRSMRE
jgi:hypothetical protein